MLHIKVKSNDIRFTIPIPYPILNACISILSSKFFHQRLHHWTKEHFKKKQLDFTILDIDRKALKPIYKELKKHRGLVLVDLKAKDGTEVVIGL
jgi:plasmid replication initiation protein